jgi:manganese oxidase
MTNHPIHIHGHHFGVACTDGGWVSAGARWPETTIDVPVGSIRAIEFVADNPGDWAFHCHKSHHVMNAMGHDVPTMIGVDHRGIAEKINRLVPDYMVMGDRGGSMEHEMPLPDNTLPMMSGKGPFGAMEMGGMFTVVKVREGLGRNDYKDPGWYKHPAGTVAYDWNGEAPAAARQSSSPGEATFKASKPKGHAGH